MIIAPVPIEDRAHRDQSMADGSPSHGYNQPDHQGRKPRESWIGKNAGIANRLSQRLRRLRNPKQGGLLPLIGFSTTSVGKESAFLKTSKICKSGGGILVHFCGIRTQ